MGNLNEILHLNKEIGNHEESKITCENDCESDMGKHLIIIRRC